MLAIQKKKKPAVKKFTHLSIVFQVCIAKQHEEAMLLNNRINYHGKKTKQITPFTVDRLHTLQNSIR